jgi:pimeloyl-ACP methyl ester carboxylesterase
MSVAVSEVRLRRFQGDGLTITADEAGPETGRPVLLLHGGGQTRHAWGKALREGANRGYHMFSADLRGHGDSGWSEAGDYHIEAHARDLGRMIAQIGELPVVVGASMGGLTGLYYAGEMGPVRALVLVDVAPRIEVKGTDKIGSFMRSAPEGFANLDEAVEAVSSFLPHRPRPKDPSGLMKNLRLRDDGRLHWHWDPKFLRMDRKAGFDGEIFRDAARKLTVPVLLVRGQMSDVLSEEGVRDFLSLCPQAEYVDIEGADHMVAGDRNDAFNDAVFDFLARHA